MYHHSYSNDTLPRVINFLSNIVTGDECWFHHFDPEMKRKTIKWHHTVSPKRKKAETTPLAGNCLLGY
jgi:hypothetical protein